MSNLDDNSPPETLDKAFESSGSSSSCNVSDAGKTLEKMQQNAEIVAFAGVTTGNLDPNAEASHFEPPIGLNVSDDDHHKETLQEQLTDISGFEHRVCCEANDEFPGKTIDRTNETTGKKSIQQTLEDCDETNPKIGSKSSVDSEYSQSEMKAALSHEQDSDHDMMNPKAGSCMTTKEIPTISLKGCTKEQRDIRTTSPPARLSPSQDPLKSKKRSPSKGEKYLAPDSLRNINTEPSTSTTRHSPTDSSELSDAAGNSGQTRNEASPRKNIFKSPLKCTHKDYKLPPIDPECFSKLDEIQQVQAEDQSCPENVTASTGVKHDDTHQKPLSKIVEDFLNPQSDSAITTDAGSPNSSDKNVQRDSDGGSDRDSISKDDTSESGSGKLCLQKEIKIQHPTHLPLTRASTLDPGYAADDERSSLSRHMSVDRDGDVPSFDRLKPDEDIDELSFYQDENVQSNVFSSDAQDEQHSLPDPTDTEENLGENTEDEGAVGYSTEIKPGSNVDESYTSGDQETSLSDAAGYKGLKEWIKEGAKIGDHLTVPHQVDSSYETDRKDSESSEHEKHIGAAEVSLGDDSTRKLHGTRRDETRIDCDKAERGPRAKTDNLEATDSNPPKTVHRESQTKRKLENDKDDACSLPAREPNVRDTIGDSQAEIAISFKEKKHARWPEKRSKSCESFSPSSISVFLPKRSSSSDASVSGSQVIPRRQSLEQDGDVQMQEDGSNISDADEEMKVDPEGSSELEVPKSDKNAE